MLPRPEVDYKAGDELWGLSRPILCNLYGIVFAVLTIYAVKNLYFILHATGGIFFQRKKIFVAVNCILCYFSLLSALSLLLDPYLIGVYFKDLGPLSKGIVSVIIGTKLPCLTVSFSLITMSLLEATKMQVYSKRLQNHRCITAIAMFHFTFGLSTDTLTVFYLKNRRLGALICKIGMVLISFVMGIASFVAGYKVIRCYGNNIHSLKAMAETSAASDNEFTMGIHKSISLTTSHEEVSIVKKLRENVTNVCDTFKDRSMRRVAKMTMATTASNFCYGIIVVYAVINMFRKQSKNDVLWSWFLTNIFLSFSEIFMVSVMLYVVRRGRFFCKC